jgi:hypothetical protein
MLQRPTQSPDLMGDFSIIPGMEIPEGSLTL